MSGRGVTKVADLRARSIIDPQTGCWHWQGAKSAGVPRIHTFDHELGEKRSMSGPKAVWNIAHGEAPGPAFLVFRRCVCSDCVNPVHMARALSKAEIGRHVGLTNARKGTSLPQRQANIRKAWEATGITVTPPEVVRAIRAAGKEQTSTSLAAVHGIAHQTVSLIRRGQSHKHLLEAA